MNKIIELYHNEDIAINSAYENTVLNISLKKEQNNYKTFVLCGCEPAVGTTSTVVELAIALSLTGSKIIILDGDFKKENTYKRMNDNISSGLVNYIKDGVLLKDIIHKTNWDNLHYIPCGKTITNDSLKLLYSPAITQLMKELKKQYDYILIDAPSLSVSLDSIFFALKSDAVILVVALDGSKKKYLEVASKQLIDSGVNLIGVIQNKVSIEEYKHYIKDYDYLSKSTFTQNSIEIKARKENGNEKNS